MRNILILSVLFMIWLWYGDDILYTLRAKPIPPSLMQRIYTDPLQYETQKPNIVFGDGIIDFLATYDITARVLSRENYYFDAGSRISPMDLALGWGPMALPNIAKELNIGQSIRFYHIYWNSFSAFDKNDAPPIDFSQIMLNSANVHIVPADKIVKKKLNKVKGGQLVTLQGYLIRYREPEGWHWQSSLTRKDTGNGSCELLYVENVTIY